jgi:ABC-type nickel/cobalt efflux system permease component RcnA
MTMISQKQAYISMLVVAFAIIMITGYILTSSLDNSAFSSRNHHHSHHHSHHHQDKISNTNQIIGQSGQQPQRSFCQSVGANSPVSASCNNAAANANANIGGNGAASNQ